MQVGAGDGELYLVMNMVDSPFTWQGDKYWEGVENKEVTVTGIKFSGGGDETEQCNSNLDVLGLDCSDNCATLWMY